VYKEWVITDRYGKWNALCPSCHPSYARRKITHSIGGVELFHGVFFSGDWQDLRFFMSNIGISPVIGFLTPL